MDFVRCEIFFLKVMALIFYNTGMQNLNEQNKSFPVDKCLTNVPVFCQICISLRGFVPALLSDRLHGLSFLFPACLLLLSVTFSFPIYRDRSKLMTRIPTLRTSVFQVIQFMPFIPLKQRLSLVGYAMLSIGNQG